ncbi:MAG TPA: hypothetical protein DGP89_08255 [Saprospirales bacterium]|nr:hypothetical protein [Saprospirales bacterium]
MNNHNLTFQKIYADKYESETEQRRFFAVKLVDEHATRYIELPKTFGRGYEFVEDTVEYIADFYGVDIADIKQCNETRMTPCPYNKHPNIFEDKNISYLNYPQFVMTLDEQKRMKDMEVV